MLPHRTHGAYFYLKIARSLRFYSCGRGSDRSRGRGLIVPIFARLKMEDLPAKAFSATAEPGIIVPGNQSASEIAPAVPSVEEVQNCHVRENDAKHAAAAHRAGETLDETAVAVDKEASVGKLSGDRGDHVHGVGHEISPVTELTHDRLDHSSTVQRKLSEALPALLSLPSETALLELGPLGSPKPLYQPEGSGHWSRAPPAASGPPVCPSSDFRASSRYATLEPCPCRPSSVACCCCWSPARRLPEPCRCSHHDPAASPCLAPILPSHASFGRSYLVSPLSSTSPRVDSLQACESG